ncbi:hypothetical protein Tco_0823280 [Tanacetum coccineum]|uniref:Integrase, catalytic region, zinc finger, CCHC-type, peptidase aspartic, catalytic n=1 Tax=Tanacetum coccineum TaxID=301880 RepID=A0ABQ5AIG3_9ASTR
MSPLQINTKFLNHLQPEWKRFVIGVKQSKDLHKVSYDQLFAYLKQNQDDAYEIRAERAARSHDPLALVSNTYNSTPYINPTPKYNQQVYMLYNNLMLHNNLWRYNNPMNLESVRYGISKVLDTAYCGFLRRIGSCFLRDLGDYKARYAESSLMDTAYWSSEQ